MLKMKEPKYVTATLKWCNKLRKERGKNPLKRMPKGRRRDPGTCPCGAATGCRVGLNAYYWPGTTDCRLLPSAVVRFVYEFDSGKLPQYEL